MNLTRSASKRIEGIAELLEREARSWEEGFAAMKLEDITPGYYVATRDVWPHAFGRVFEGYFCGEKVEKWHNSGWTFTRFVPADEVEKAWREGCEFGQVNCGEPINHSLTFSESRAKRIAEGLE